MKIAVPSTNLRLSPCFCGAILVLLVGNGSLFAAETPLVDTSESPHATLEPLALEQVRLTDGFWADRFATVRDVTLPHLLDLAEDPEMGHAVANLRIAAGLEDGEFAGTDWQDAWVYKWIESAAAVHETTRDEELDRRMDELIAVIARAQEPDGYIASQNTARKRPRFQKPNHHECYTMGHLLTAACIHHRVTGKTTFLDVARKTGDFLHRRFRDHKREMAHFPVNPSVVMGAVELYRVTKEPRYLELAELVVDARGAFSGGSDLNQDRVPLRDETDVVGHAVFYTYLYAGATDIYMETGDDRLLAALDRLWTDLVERKMYITGGCCALHKGLSVRNGNVWGADSVHEAAGAAYYLPNDAAYNETCAQVGTFMWNWRMLQARPDAKFADIMEREMYNGFLPGISLGGDRFFYTNPLRWYGEDQALKSNDTQGRHEIGRESRICCPTNVMRTIAEFRSYLYSVQPDTLWVHHFAGSTVDDGQWRVTQTTGYPWDEIVRLTIERAPEQGTIRLRIPGWASDATITINGREEAIDALPGTYIEVRRDWREGDELLLRLPMPPRLMAANARVESARNQAAVMRGPIVYCLESADLPDGVELSEVVIPRDIPWREQFEPNLLGGVTTLTGEAICPPRSDDALYSPLTSEPVRRISIRLIPYYAWANRGVGEMSVWLPIAW